MVLKTLVYKFRQAGSGVPLQVKQFVIKATSLFAGWCLLYAFLLKPYGLIDPVLTKYTGKVTVWLMQYFYQGQHPAAVYTDKAVLISLNNKHALSIWDPCNGLELYALFIGFILCVPMEKWKMARYLLIGIIGIFVLNVLRCLALLYLFAHHSAYAGLAHHYFFQMAVYAAIFILWERYFRSLKVNHDTAPV